MESQHGYFNQWRYIPLRKVEANIFLFRIGLNGFDNPMREQKTEECKRRIDEVSNLDYQYHL